MNVRIARLTCLWAFLLAFGCGGDPCEGSACLDGAPAEDASMRRDSGPERDAGPEPDAGDGLLCDDTCATSNDGECDDGGPDSLFSVCALGTDCGDCGPRDPDMVCTPDCTGRQCGPDGCGGLCAPGCMSGQSCGMDGRCINDGCVEDCSGRVCGADPVCGVSCGTCESDEACDAGGQCQCVPACSGRECGDDGCGGTCGEGCSGAETCTTDGRCELGLRTWGGATANLRLIVGDLLTDAAGRKVCIYGTDDDRPYLVLNRLGFSAGDTITVNATYVTAPAGIPLRVSNHITVGLGSDTAAGCNPASAVPLSADPLETGDYYTVVARTYDDFFAGACAADASEDFCEFYARSDDSLPAVDCATEGTVLYEDGFRFSGDYVGAVRIANLTVNASQIARSFASSSLGPVGNRFGGSLVNTSYDPPKSAERLRICPSFLRCDPRITGLEQSNAVFGCTNGEAPWVMAEVTSSRFTADDLATTVYVFGNSGVLNSGRDGLARTELGIVIAHDVSDGPLP